MMSCSRSFGRIGIMKKAAAAASTREFSAGAGKARKGSKGGGSDGPKTCVLTQEMKSCTVFGANILKDSGADPKILPDSEYPDWLWHLLDKQPPIERATKEEDGNPSLSRPEKIL